MNARWLRTIAAVLIPVCLVVGVGATDWPVRSRAVAAADQPAKIKELPWTNSQRLADEIGRLSRTVAGLVAVGEDSGGLHQWRESLTVHRSALQGLVGPVNEEWAANETTMSKAGVPTSALQRHWEGGAQVQQRLGITLSLLSAALANPATAETLPKEVQDLHTQLESWQRTVGPVWNEVLPFGPARSNAGSSPLPVLSEPLALPLAQGSPSEADLTQETEVDEEALAGVLSEAGSGLKSIAAWTYHNLAVQWYLDRQKSPMAVLHERTGNDTDIAGLLVFLLRRDGIPARYAHGQVVLTSGYWPGLFGLSDRKAVIDYLTGSGVPVQEHRDSSLVVPHTWVEAWDKASGTWVALDAAWKSHVWPAPKQAVEPAFDLHRYMVRGQDVSPVTFAIGEVQGEASRPVPMNLHGDGLPHLKLPSVGPGASWSTWPEGRSGQFTLAIGGSELQIPVSRVHGQRLLVSYAAATEDDRAIQTLFSTSLPSHLLRVRPVVWVGTERLLEGAPVPLGSVLEIEISWQIGGQAEIVRRQWQAGDPASLIFLARPVSPEVLIQWQKKLVWTTARTSEDLVGLQLSYMQFDFLQHTGRSTMHLAKTWNHQLVDGARLTMASFAVEYERLFGIPYADRDVRFAFDAARLATKATPRSGARDASVLFAVAVGAEASYREARAVTNTYGLNAASTVTGLAARTRQGETLAWACRLNGDTELPSVEVSAVTREHLSQGFDHNLLVVSPHSSADVEAYVLIDPTTGASGYYLNGGRNGSFSQWIGLKDKNRIVDLVGDLVSLTIGAILPPDRDKRTAALRALIYGEVDGFAAGLEGEVDGFRSIPETTGFLWRMIVDGEFRGQVVEQTLQQLQQLAQMVSELGENWDLYLQEARSSLETYLSQLSGVASSDPLFEMWVIYYPVGWMGGMIGEVVLVTLATGAVFKLIGTIPAVQRNVTAFRLLVRNLRLVNGRTLRAILLVDKLLPDTDIFGLIEKISDSRLRSLFESTLTLYFSKVDLKTLDSTEAGLKMFIDIGKAARSVQVRNDAYWAARQVWEKAGLSETEAVILRTLRPELLNDPGLKAISHAMREVVPRPEVGQRIVKVITPDKAYDMIAGRRPKNKIFGFFTLPEHIQDVRTPDEMVQRLRLDYPGGMAKSGNKEIFVLEFDYNGDPVEIPRASTLGGSASLEDSAYPFSGTGWVATDDGRWVPEFTFSDKHDLPKGVKLKRMTDDGVMTTVKVFDGENWIDLPVGEF